MDIEACPLGVAPNYRNTFPLDEEFDFSFDDRLRRLVANIHPQATHEGHLPIIYCPLAHVEGLPLAGVTRPRDKWLPYVILDPRQPARDGLTLAHEMGHAADVSETHWNLEDSASIETWEKLKLPYRPIMSYVQNRNRFFKAEVLAFARCYFRK